MGKLNFSKDVYLFEAALDAMSFAEITNIENVISFGGLQSIDLGFLNQFTGKKILCFDNDAAAENAAKGERFRGCINFTISKLLNQFGIGEKVKDWNEALQVIKLYEQENFEERAAIIEYEAGFDRQTAEKVAMKGVYHA